MLPICDTLYPPLKNISLTLSWISNFPVFAPVPTIITNGLSMSRILGIPSEYKSSLNVILSFSLDSYLISKNCFPALFIISVYIFIWLCSNGILVSATITISTSASAFWKSSVTITPVLTPSFAPASAPQYPQLFNETTLTISYSLIVSLWITIWRRDVSYGNSIAFFFFISTSYKIVIFSSNPLISCNMQ